MKEERRLALQEKLDAAYASADVANIDAIRRVIERETLECTAHTAERVKRIEQDVIETKMIVEDISESIKAAKMRVAGARWLWETLKVGASIGGGVTIMKLLVG